MRVKPAMTHNLILLSYCRDGLQTVSLITCFFLRFFFNYFTIQGIAGQARNDADSFLCRQNCCFLLPLRNSPGQWKVPFLPTRFLFSYSYLFILNFFSFSLYFFTIQGIAGQARNDTYTLWFASCPQWRVNFCVGRTAVFYSRSENLKNTKKCRTCRHAFFNAYSFLISLFFYYSGDCGSSPQWHGFILCRQNSRFLLPLRKSKKQ